MADFSPFYIDLSLRYDTIPQHSFFLYSTVYILFEFAMSFHLFRLMRSTQENDICIYVGERKTALFLSPPFFFWLDRSERVICRDSRLSKGSARGEEVYSSKAKARE